MTSLRQQDVLEVFRDPQTPSSGDARSHETPDARLRLYWPAGVLVRDDEDGAFRLASPDWEAAYAAGRQAFVDQSRTLIGLDHPNLGRLRQIIDLDLAVAVEGEPMGPSLADWLRGDGVVAPDVVLALAGDLAGGLAAAHARDLLHLDIAPETIGIGSGRAVLHDFSIDRRPYIPLVQTTEHLFRPGMAAFESQDATATLPLGPPADVYGLSAVLYRLIAGRRPPDWYAWTDEAKLSAQPSSAAYPAAFIAAVEQGLARVPADRFVTIDDWRTAAGVGEPVAGTRPWFDPPDDFHLPPTPPTPPTPPADPGDDLGPLAAPEGISATVDADADGLGALAVAYAAPAIPRAPMSRAARGALLYGGGVLAVVAVLVVIAAAIGDRVSDGTVVPADQAEATAAEHELIPAGPTGCEWRRPGEGAAETTRLALYCGAGEAAVRVDAGDLKPSDVADAAAGDASAMARYGAFLLRDTPGRDQGAGLAWLRRAATDGDRGAMLGLGDFHAAAAEADPAEASSNLRQGLEWYRTALGSGPGASASQAQAGLAEAGVALLQARLTGIMDRAFVGCWRSGGGEVAADLSIDGRTFTLAVAGADPATGEIGQPREDGRLTVTLDTPKLMRGQQYLFTRDADGMVEHRLDASTSTARWVSCSAG